MTQEQELKLLDDQFEAMKSILTSKGQDYAGKDMLQNFKQMSAAAKTLNIDCTTPVGYSLFMCLLKIQRIANLTSAGKKPNNESVSDSYDDLLSYSFLSKCVFTEQQNEIEYAATSNI